MSKIGTRIAALEQRVGSRRGKVHRIVQRIGQSRDEAISLYGRDLIADHDLLIVREIIAPKGRGVSCQL